MTLPTWHPVAGRDRWHEVEVLADEANHAAGQCIAIVETFGQGWYEPSVSATALPGDYSTRQKACRHCDTLQKIA